MFLLSFRCEDFIRELVDHLIEELSLELDIEELNERGLRKLL